MTARTWGREVIGEPCECWPQGRRAGFSEVCAVGCGKCVGRVGRRGVWSGIDRRMGRRLHRKEFGSTGRRNQVKLVQEAPPEGVWLHRKEEPGEALARNRRKGGGLRDVF